MTAGKQTGIALISVLWVVGLLSVVAVGLSASLRNDIRVAAHSIAAAQARRAAEGGVHRALYELLAARGKTDDTLREFSVGEATVRVTASDEAGRIDLNAAPAALLDGVLATAGLPEPERRSLVDAILDWRDADHDVRPYGAEDSEYRSQGSAYGAKDAPFDSVEELSLVLGMSPALFAKLKPLLTVHSRQAGVNPAAASKELLLAIAGADTTLPQQFVARPSATFSIHAQARVRNGATAHVTATVNLNAPRQQPPFTLRDWRPNGPELFSPAEGG
jgi:general secretion pathway protein K